MAIIPSPPIDTLSNQLWNWILTVGKYEIDRILTRCRKVFQQREEGEALTSGFKRLTDNFRAGSDNKRIVNRYSRLGRTRASPGSDLYGASSWISATRSRSRDNSNRDGFTAALKSQTFGLHTALWVARSLFVYPPRHRVLRTERSPAVRWTTDTSNIRRYEFSGFSNWLTRYSSDSFFAGFVWKIYIELI